MIYISAEIKKARIRCFKKISKKIKKLLDKKNCI